jgi:hypothetical protein
VRSAAIRLGDPPGLTTVVRIGPYNRRRCTAPFCCNPPSATKGRGRR